MGEKEEGRRSIVVCGEKLLEGEGHVQTRKTLYVGWSHGNC